MEQMAGHKVVGVHRRQGWIDLGTISKYMGAPCSEIASGRRVYDAQDFSPEIIILLIPPGIGCSGDIADKTSGCKDEAGS
jgi:hypothetical protein